MIRTTIMLPAEVKRQAENEARGLKVSFADFVREAISEKLPQNRGGADRLNRLKRRRQDPLFRLLDRLPATRQSAATDVAANHDAYLHGGKSGFRGP